MNTWTIQRIGSRAAGTMLGAAVVFALMLMTARQAGAQYQEREGVYEACTDGAWARYNGCLMTSKTWLGRLHCDVDLQMNVTACVTAEIEETRYSPRKS